MVKHDECLRECEDHLQIRYEIVRIPGEIYPEIDSYAITWKSTFLDDINTFCQQKGLRRPDECKVTLVIDDWGAVGYWTRLNLIQRKTDLIWEPCKQRKETISHSMWGKETKFVRCPTSHKRVEVTHQGGILVQPGDPYYPPLETTGGSWVGQSPDALMQAMKDHLPTAIKDDFNSGGMNSFIDNCVSKLGKSLANCLDLSKCSIG